MAEKKQSKLKRKLRVAVFAENSYEQLFSLRLSPINLFISIGLIAILLIVGVTILISFTSLREYIPGYPTGEERHMIMENLQRTDSLILEVKLRDKIISDIRSAISGELPLEALSHDSLQAQQTKFAQKVSFEKSQADSIFRAQIEAEERFNVSEDKGSQSFVDERLEMMFLYSPIKGVVTNSFGESVGHFGVDIVSPEGSRVSSILDGTVIFAEWTVETGYVIQIQHDNQLVSIYKHNSKLLKRVGSRVQAGEVIALVGNSGELSTGPHLHFELWYSGVPLNPENYISFQ